jgi:sugar lactone lactonase YvrE
MCGSQTAFAYTTASGYAAHDFATGFPATNPASPWAPIGVAFDQSDNLYVVDSADANIYRFDQDGGAASDVTRLTSSPIPGEPTGLAVAADGRMYLARHTAGDIVEIDPGTATVLRRVAGGLTCASALAVDPASGDLFVSGNECASSIYRVSPTTGQVSAYTSNTPGVDGIAFGNQGTLYAADAGAILSIQGTQAPAPGSVTEIARVTGADGLAFAPADKSGQIPYLIVNRTDGTVTKVDIGQGSTTSTDIMTGGTRGDLAAVDSSGCLYVTQARSIVRITPAHGACALAPTTTGSVPPAGVVLEPQDAEPQDANGMQLGTTGPHAKRCVPRRTLTIRLRQRGRVRLRSAVIYVNGRVSARIRGSKLRGRIVLRRLPRGAVKVKVVAVDSRGRRLTTVMRYRNC